MRDCPILILMVSGVSKKKPRAVQRGGGLARVRRGLASVVAGFHESGFSVEWHDFECESPLDWAGSFHPDSVEICLNLDGHAEFSLAGKKSELPPASATFYFSGREQLTARRLRRSGINLSPWKSPRNF